MVHARAWLATAALIGVLAGCEQDPRIPYIPPTLANWPQPYRGVAGLKIHVFVTGFLRLPEAMLLRGGSLTRTRDLPVPAVLIEHPKQGLVLFNTGMAPLRPDETPAPSDWTQLVGVQRLRGTALTTQMQQAGMKPQAVRWVVMSTLDANHAGAAAQFPEARVVVAKREHEHARQAPSGYTPDDFAAVANWKFIDFEPPQPLGTFLAHVDLFGDASCLLIDASGPTPGTMALLVRLAQRPLLLADDLAAVEESLRYTAMPASVQDRTLWWNNIWRLKRFADLAPELLVMPGYDVTAVQAAGLKDVVVHPFSPPPASTTTSPTPALWRRLLPSS